MPNDYVALTLNDNTVRNGSPERTTFRLPVAPIDSTNIDTIETQLGSLVSAVAGVSIGVLYRTVTSITEENPDTAAPSPLAQRENKWRVTMVGGGEKISFTIGTANLTLLEANTENMADGAERTALINALQALVKASDGVTPMTVQLPIIFVGRNT